MEPSRPVQSNTVIENYAQLDASVNRFVETQYSSSDAAYGSVGGMGWYGEMQDMSWLNSFPFDMGFDILSEDMSI